MFKLAADQYLADAQYRLGLMMAKKQGSKEGTWLEAMSLIQKAADGGLGKAKNYIVRVNTLDEVSDDEKDDDDNDGDHVN